MLLSLEAHGADRKEGLMMGISNLYTSRIWGGEGVSHVSGTRNTWNNKTMPKLAPHSPASRPLACVPLGLFLLPGDYSSWSQLPRPHHRSPWGPPNSLGEGWGKVDQGCFGLWPVLVCSPLRSGGWLSRDSGEILSCYKLQQACVSGRWERQTEGWKLCQEPAGG